MKSYSFKKQVLSILLVVAMLIGMMPIQVFAATGIVKVSNASDLPATLEAGMTYELTTDIELASGQQIASIAGVLDGKGHTITLDGKPLASNVTGTIQNLGVLGAVTTGDFSGEGAVAVTLDGGTIQNCYSTVAVTGGMMADVSGFVGTMKNNAVLRNSFYVGTAKPGDWATVGGASVYASGTVTISDFYYNSGSLTAYTSSGIVQNNCALKSNSDFASQNIVVLLNSNIEPTGYIWKLTDGQAYPTLVEGKISVTVDKSGLEAVIGNAKSLDETKYSESTWKNLEKALAEAEAVNKKEDASKSEVKAATDKLENAIKALEKKKATVPVAKPTDEAQIVHISNQTQLENIGAGDENKYYVLDNDITLDNWYMSFYAFNGVFDGNGHTISFADSWTGLFKDLGPNGIVQNVHFTGSLGASADYGAVARYVKGSIVNCYSEIKGNAASGFAKGLDGGMISNCYSISKAGNGVILGIANESYTGTLKNVYWQEDLSQKADLSKLIVDNASALRFSAMTTLDFVEKLNNNKGEYGISWGQNSNGYPYFGENKNYVPGAVELPENKGIAMSFTPNGGDTVKVENNQIVVDKNKANLTGYAGKFELVNYDVPEGSKVVWGCTQQIPEETAAITLENSVGAEDAGEFYVYKAGTVVVTATLVDSDNKETVLAAAKVDTYAAEIEAIKLYVADYDGKNAVAVKDGKATVNGSSDMQIVVEAKYKDSAVYQSVASTAFGFKMTAEEGVVKHYDNSSTFKFNKPGTAIMTVTYNNNSDVSASVELTSKYVEANSVVPGINGTYYLHQRNGNSSNGAPFVTIYANPAIVTPSNASNAGNYTITSSDESIAKHIQSMANGFVPYKAGTVTFTATINDNGKEISGDSTVEFKYLNPLKAVTVKEESLTIKNGETVSVGLEFKGTTDTLKHISETGMVWSYDKEGIVTVIRDAGSWYNDGTLDNTGYFLSEQYNVKALSEGTVTITGTPVDTTGGAEPVTIKVTVEKSDLPIADINKIISEGIGLSSDYLLNMAKDGLVYGHEWNIITLLRADKTIHKEVLDAYYEAVVAEIKTWDGSEKPTDIERVALALAAMGKDITDVDGVNLAEMIYNSDKLSNGSNELAFALLALDALDTDVPADAKWSREAMVAEMLKFQNEEGFFGLGDNKTASLDMTCMCLQSLAPYRGEQEIDEAIEAGLAYLKSQISGNYDFAGNSNSTAQVLLTLAVLGIDVTDQTKGFGNAYDNIITRLDDYRTEDGFAYTLDGKTNAVATYQVMQAFDAYRKATDEGISYWNFSEKSDEKYDDKFDDKFNGELDDKFDNNLSGDVSGDDNADEKPVDSNAPTTGDFNTMALWVVVMAAAITGAMALKKREN